MASADFMLRAISLGVVIAFTNVALAGQAQCELVLSDGVERSLRHGEQGYLSTASVEIDSSKSDKDAAKSFYEEAEQLAKAFLLKRLIPNWDEESPKQVVGYEVVAKCIFRQRAYAQVFVSNASIKIAQEIKGGIQDSLKTNPTRKPDVSSPSILDGENFDLNKKAVTPSLLGL